MMTADEWTRLLERKAAMSEEFKQADKLLTEVARLAAALRSLKTPHLGSCYAVARDACSCSASSQHAMIERLIAGDVTRAGCGECAARGCQKCEWQGHVETKRGD